MKRRKHYDRSVYRSLVLITQFGINMLVPICMMTALGIFLDRKWNTSYWTIILFFLGALAGGRNIYRMAKQIYTEPSKGHTQKGHGSTNADSGDIKKEK